MNLFDRKKDLIHRLANLLLLIWFLGASFLLYSNLVNLVLKKPLLSAEEYELRYCFNLEREKDNTDDTKDKLNREYCNRQYRQYLISEKNNIYSKRMVFSALGNVIIVGSTLYLLNRKKAT
ncbi:MAG: hypothetical protein ACOXZW_01330 [Bacilli bacterium]|jgi:hypothetical protein|nr:hypothetical protein [Bacilli bacterium]